MTFVPRNVPRTGAQRGCAPSLTWEPVSGFEPLTCRLQEVRPRTPGALAAPMTRVIALMALTALGLSGAPVHEPVHSRGPMSIRSATVRNIAESAPPTSARASSVIMELSAMLKALAYALLTW